MSLLDLTAADISRLAEEAFQDVLRRIGQGQDARDAIDAVQATFNGRYVQALSEAFSELLQTPESAGQVRALPIGEVSLSSRLYANAREVSSAARQVIRQHAEAMTDARKLALDLYEGYGFKGGADPLRVKSELPKYLREALQDAEFGASYQVLLRRIQTTQLKTEAMKAAYLQAIDAAIEGPGGRRLERALRVAHFERNRYFANRIAQTELHRADTDRRGAEIMADADLEVVQIVLSSTHPRADICDLHASVNKFGLGPGCYPKARAPKPPFHPFCRCLLRKRYDLSAKLARERDSADREWLEQRDDANRIVGSREKAAEVLAGRPLVEVINEGKHPLYAMRWLGDVGGPDSKAMTSSSDVGRRIVTGLIRSASTAPAEPEARLRTLWANASRFDSHVRRRLEDGSVGSAAEYAFRTFEVLATAKSLLVVEPADQSMLPTGMAQLAGGDWIVLLSAGGGIVTSYRYIPEKVQFEQRHREAGDNVRNYQIEEFDRAVLAKLFGRG